MENLSNISIDIFKRDSVMRNTEEWAMSEIIGPPYTSVTWNRNN